MNYRYLVYLGGIVVLYSACRPSESASNSVMMVKADTVQGYRHELTTTYPGRVKPAADVDLSFRVSGPLVHVSPEVGHFVKKGEMVAEIDPRDYEIQLQATEAEYRQVKAEAERVIKLYQLKSVPENDYDRAVSGLQQISAKFAAHTNALKDTRLLAPFDGYIQKKYFDVNETVAAGMPVVSMIDTRYFEVEIDIPSGDYVLRESFRKFSAVADVFPQKVFPLELIDITKKANLNQLYRMRFRLEPESGYPLAAGMSVNVTIEYDSGEKTLTCVPLSALFEDHGISSVWIYEKDRKKVTRREVKVLQVLKDGRAVLDEGVREGETVVTAGVHKLKEGMDVELLKPVSRTNIGGLL